MTKQNCIICGKPLPEKSKKRKYCSDECSRIAKNMCAKKQYIESHRYNEHKEKVRAEPKEIRKKSHLDKDIKEMCKNGDTLGIKSYDYGKYALIKGY